MDKQYDLPISVRFAEPWVEDNKQFVEQVKSEYSGVLTRIKDDLRPKLEKSRLIKKAGKGKPSLMAAVDASVVDVQVEDMSTVLVQAALHYDGKTDFDKPMRFGPFTSEDARYVRTPARFSREVAMLNACPAGQTVIVDNSFWSFLMEVNQAITAFSNHLGSDERFEGIVDEIVSGFPMMLENEFAIAMPKSSVSQSISKNPKFKDLFVQPIADRPVCSRVLDADEYLRPEPLKDVGSFGMGKKNKVNVEQRKFSPQQVDRIKEIYESELYFTYYKPWPYSRAYRIEARKDKFTNDLFASIKEATRLREIAEPEPQFLVDHAVKQINAVQQLYSGKLNAFRTPFIGFHRTARW